MMIDEFGKVNSIIEIEAHFLPTFLHIASDSGAWIDRVENIHQRFEIFVLNGSDLVLVEQMEAVYA